MDDAKREKEKFEYLFLDIEWNQAPGTTGLDGREAIQIFQDGLFTCKRIR